MCIILAINPRARGRGGSIQTEKRDMGTSGAGCTMRMAVVPAKTKRKRMGRGGGGGGKKSRGGGGGGGGGGTEVKGWRHEMCVKMCMSERVYCVCGDQL